MGNKTSIEWTRGEDGKLGSTWNPIRGCSRVSEGCRNCYAEAMAARFCGGGQPYHGLVIRHESGPRWSGDVRVIAEKLAEPLRWQRPRLVFVNSMSDLFHIEVCDQDIAAIFGIMAAAPKHTFQILTKRSQRMENWFRKVGANGEGALEYCVVKAISLLRQRIALTPKHEAALRCAMIESRWPLPNVWLGVSAEDQSAADVRVPNLLRCPATVRWVSAEPLIGPVSLEQYADVASCGPDGEAEDHDGRLGLDWVVVGGESGPRARSMSVEWVEDLVTELTRCDVSVFVKQLGAHPIRDMFSEHRGEMEAEPLLLRHSKGGDMSEWPEGLRVRQWPKGATR